MYFKEMFNKFSEKYNIHNLNKEIFWPTQGQKVSSNYYYYFFNVYSSIMLSEQTGKANKDPQFKSLKQDSASFLTEGIILIL